MADTPKDGNSLSRRQAVAAIGAGALVAGGAVALTATELANRSKSEAEQQLDVLNSKLAVAGTTQDALQQQLADANKVQADLQQQLAQAEKNASALEQQLAAAHQQLDVYRGLAGLYATLDNINVDAVVGTALGAYKSTLVALQGGVNVLREGIVRAESALDNFENGFAAIRESLTAAEAAWANVNALLKNVQDLLKNASAPLLPLVDQAHRFFDDLLGKIPFGAGEGARQTINGMVGLVVAVPDALGTLQSGLFRTLREGWFSDDNARSLEATLAKPITEGVLQPARAFLGQVDTALGSWETQVAQPVNTALSQREIVQEQIASYKKQNNLS